MEPLIVFLVIAGTLAVIPAKIAESKGRDFVVWWLYGFLLWIVALIHSIVIGPSGQAIDDKAIAAGNLKCPSCAEWIKREAKVCRFCGRDVEPAFKAVEVPAQTVIKLQDEKNWGNPDRP